MEVNEKGSKASAVTGIYNIYIYIYIKIMSMFVILTIDINYYIAILVKNRYWDFQTCRL